MIVNLWMGFNDRARPNAEPQGEAPGHSAYRALGDPATRRIFRKDNPNGPRDYELWSLYYDVETEKELRDIRNDLNAEFPGQVRTVGAWHWDGRQVGQEFTFNEDGEITGVTGNPMFPLHTRILEFIPDIVTHDVDGNETSRVRPTAPSDVNLGFGQAPRRF